MLVQPNLIRSLIYSSNGQYFMCCIIVCKLLFSLYLGFYAAECRRAFLQMSGSFHEFCCCLQQNLSFSSTVQIPFESLDALKQCSTGICVNVYKVQ